MSRRLQVVLVEPQESLNIGSVARAMKNFGIADLHLVAPREYEPKRAAITACWAGDILERITIHETIDGALAPFDEIAGFSARSGRNRGRENSLEGWAKEINSSAARNVALMFGPEDTGLRQEHIERCHTRVWIPTDAACPALNLSHAVALALYETSRSVARDVGEPDEPLAADSELQAIIRLVDSSAELSGFFADGTPAPVPGVLRNIFRRMTLNRREAAILLGFLGCTERTMRGKRPVH